MVEFSQNTHKNQRSCIFCENLQLHQQNHVLALMNSHWDKSFETIRSFILHLLEKLVPSMNTYNVFLKPVSTTMSCCWINIDSKWTPQTGKWSVITQEAKSRPCLLHSSWISSGQNCSRIWVSSMQLAFNYPILIEHLALKFIKITTTLCQEVQSSFYYQPCKTGTVIPTDRNEEIESLKQ